ncbi:MAG: hypothetical protein Q8L29_01690 [archaeon]|nr:hypothetical protein [archaeon]
MAKPYQITIYKSDPQYKFIKKFLSPILRQASDDGRTYPSNPASNSYHLFNGIICNNIGESFTFRHDTKEGLNNMLKKSGCPRPKQLIFLI